MKQFKHELLRKNLLFLYSIAGVGALGLGLFRPILPIFARRVGASGFEVGLLTSGYMFARAIISIIIGKFIDLSGRKKIFIEFGFFFVFIITFGLLFVKSYHFLFLLPGFIFSYIFTLSKRRTGICYKINFNKRRSY